MNTPDKSRSYSAQHVKRALRAIAIAFGLWIVAFGGYLVFRALADDALLERGGGMFIPMFMFLLVGIALVIVQGYRTCRKFGGFRRWAEHARKNPPPLPRVSLGALGWSLYVLAFGIMSGGAMTTGDSAMLVGAYMLVAVAVSAQIWFTPAWRLLDEHGAPPQAQNTQNETTE
jgi:hypothetical protein